MKTRSLNSKALLGKGETLRKKQEANAGKPRIKKAGSGRKWAESEAKLRAVFAAMQDVVLVIDSEGIYRDIAPTNPNLLYRPAQDLLGKSLYDVFPRKQAEQFMTITRRVLDANQTEQIEYELPIQGKNLWFSAFITPMDNNHSVWVARDITDRKNAEEALRESEERYRSLIELSPDAMAVLDGEKVLFANSTAAKIEGLENPDKAIGMPIMELIHPDSRQRLAKLVRDMIKEWKRMPPSEEKLQRKDGSAVDVEIEAMPLLWNKRPVIQVTFRDITQRKRIEEALKAERNLLRTLIDATPDQIFVKDKQGCKIVANKADWQASGGKTMEDVLGKSDFQTYPSDLAAKFWADDKMVMDTGTPVINREESNRDAHGNPVWVLTTKVPLRDSQGNIIGLVGISRDITERRRVEEALRLSEDKFSTAFRISPDSVNFNRLSDGMYLDINQGFTRLTGYTSEDVRGKTSIDINIWADPNDRIRLVKGLREHGAVENLEAGFRSKDGQIKTGLMSAKIIQIDNEPCILSITRDISERKQAEVALHESQQMLQTVLDTIPVRVFWKDRNSNFLGCNRPFALDSGLHSPDELLGKDDFQMGWREQAELYRSDDRLVMETGTPKIGYEEPQTTPDGDRIWLRTSKVPLLNSEGKTVGMLGTYEDITAHKQAEEQILQLNHLYAMLSQINQVIVRVSDHEVLFREICRAAVEQGEYRMAWIGLRDETIQAIKPIAFAGYEQGYLAKIQLPLNPDAETGRGPGVTSVRENRCVTIQDIATDPRMGPWREEALQRGYRSVASVPFRQHEKVIGMLSVYSGEVNVFTADEEDLLTEISRDISFALDQMATETARKQADEKIHQQVERLTALNAIDQAISSSFDLHISLSILLFHAIQQLKVDAMDVLLFNPNLNVLEYFMGRGFRTTDFERAKVDLGDEGAGRVALNRQIVAISNLSKAGPPFSRAKLLEAESFVAYYGMPLIAKGKIKGVLEVFHRAPLEPDQEWLDFLNMLAGQAAISIDNYQLFDEIQKSNIELRLAYDTTIEGWSHALDLRHKETEGHTQRVVEMMLKLADAAGMTEKELVHVRRGALLHDIGKMGIPDSILLKADQLNEEEWKIMRQHPTFAYEMLSRIDYLRPALDIPYCHHEKWDGTGYPRGLKGEQIPRAARLFAIVDVWDALRSDRSYRKSWPKEKVLEHIRSLSGTYFDPYAVELFLAEFDEHR